MLIRLLGRHHEERTHDLSVRVSPAELPAHGRDEVGGYGGETVANEEDDL
ncbi:hypothetical protein [Streptosporangium lutulentum]|uniref:Uncharacterized protein n=1 Tax=Streptosporangium lutulentum TaxID=1461250 RepID=A0ABT9Q7Y1_9ACTN|nr:hypothetical protein [Streptosporangium lutulentum]MDP9842861.1 hypothetical protein [Streptosporangium lutulentum]